MEKMRASASTQIMALIWKNAKMQQRQKRATLVEIVLPAVFCCILVVVRAKVPVIQRPNGANFMPFSPHNIPFWPNKVAYAPNNSETDYVMHRVTAIIAACNTTTNCTTTVPLYVQGFVNEAAMVSFLTRQLQDSTGLENTWLGGVTFNTPKLSTVQQIHYSVRLPSTQRNQFMQTQASTAEYQPFGNDVGWETARTYPVLRPLGPRKPDDNFGGSPGYFAEGFLSIQYGVDMALAEYITNNTNASDQLGTFLWRFPYPQYTDDRVITMVENNFSMLLMLGFIIIVLNITRNIVLEKEKRLKEFMKVMGLSNWVHWVSHYVWSMAFMLIPILIITVIICAPISADKVLVNSDASVIFFFFIIYANSCITFSFAVSTCFTKGNTAAAASGLLKLASYLLYFYVKPNYFGLSYSQKVSTCLFFNTCMALGVQMIGMWEGRGVGMQWSNLSSQISKDDTFSMSTVLVMLVFDSVLCFIIAWYVEAVFPGDQGIKQHWLFPFKLSYWNPGKYGQKIGEICMESQEMRVLDVEKEHSDTSDRLKSENTSVFEADPNLNPMVNFKMLRKVYKVKKETKIAVEGLNMNFYQGQVTALLGHNGAGKSTTISMLTGLTGPSSGTAFVDGIDISSDMTQIRETLGLCPQYNVLFDSLTVNEHLILYCRLKGISNAEFECKCMLEHLRMSDKRNALSCTLSGGMKRKLSVGIALLGDSKLVLLDEPTAGMDPSARRSTWDLLQRARAGRSMVLTTHFMEEADLLADRIAIMAQGKVKCCGSSLFLKNRYGDGYKLALNMEPALAHHAHLLNIKTTLCDFAPGTIIDSRAGMQATFKLPQNYLDKFEAMFEYLEEKQNDLGIINFGVSETTMEEVFLKVGGSGSDEESADNRPPSVSLEIDTNAEGDTAENILEQDIDFKLLDPQRESGYKLWLLQMQALFYKKLYHSMRNWKMSVVQLLVVMLLTFLVLLVDNAVPIAGSSEPLLLTLDPFILDSGKLHVPYLFDPKLDQLGQAFNGEFERSIEMDNVTKIFKTDAAWLPYTTGSPLDFQDDIFGLLSYLTVKSKQDEINFFSHNIIATYFQTGNVVQSYIDGLYKRKALGYFDKYPERWESMQKGLAYLGTVLNSSSTLINATGVALFNNQAYHTPAIALNAFDNAILASWLNSTGEHTMKITTSNHPLPPVSIDMIAEFRNSQVISFSFGFTVLLGLAFVTTTFVVFLIKENSNGAKHLQYLTGLHPLLFWFCNFVWDFFNLLPGNLLLIIPVAAFDMKAFTEDGRMGQLFWMLCMYTASVLSYNYLASFFHTDPTVGYVKTAILGLLFGAGFMLTTAVLEIPQLGLESVNNILYWIFMVLSPHYCLGQAFRDFQDNYLAAQSCKPVLAIPGVCLKMANACCPNCDSGLCLQFSDDYFQWSKPGVGQELFFLYVHFLLSWFILICIEMGYFRKAENYFRTDRSADFERDEEAEYNERVSDACSIESTKMGNVEDQAYHTLEEDGLWSSAASTSTILPEDSVSNLVKLKSKTSLPASSRKLTSASAIGTSKFVKKDDNNVIEDEDVSREQTKVDTSTADELESNGGVLVLKRLQKDFGKFVAVHHLSLCVNGTECFGLLGVNGAGKTTTFRMITGEEVITDGDAFIAGHSTINDRNKAITSIGYCPQFDALIDQMTGYETMQMFARLRGISDLLIKPMADVLFHLLALTPHRNKMVQAYSGGNKRKLSIAVSLIGGPKVLLMDEPTNGIDPGARRLVWKLLAKIQDYGIPIVLTSHSMDECEALCTRIGIMVGGRFKCLGSPQHLRDKFGTGYTILMKVDRIRRIEKAVQVIKENFPGTSVKEIHQKVIHFQVPKQGVPYSLLFRTVCSLKSMLHIVDYSVSQTTLEQIFLNFTRENEE